MRFINAKVHGMLDYAVAVALIVAPFVLDFASESEAAFWISFGGGAGLLVYSLLTSYPSGVRQLIPFRLHLVFDLLAAVALLVSPVLFGFGGVPMIFFASVGVAVIAVVALTNPEVDSSESLYARRATRAA